MPELDQEQAGTSTLDQAAVEDEPDFIAHLKATGAPEEIIENARKGAMMQSAFTKKTQAVAEFRDQLAAEQAQFRQQMAFLQGQAAAGGNGGGPKTRLQSFLANLEQDESGRAVAPLFKEFAEAMSGDIVPQFQQQLQQSVGPIQAANVESRIDQVLETMLVEDLIPSFGEDVRTLWPKIKQGTKQLLANGNTHVTPRFVLQEYYSNEAIRMRAAKEAEKQAKVAKQSMAGLDTARRRTPLPQGGNPTQQSPKSFDVAEFSQQWLANREKKGRKVK